MVVKYIPVIGIRNIDYRMMVYFGYDGGIQKAPHFFHYRQILQEQKNADWLFYYTENINYKKRELKH